MLEMGGSLGWRSNWLQRAETIRDEIDAAVREHGIVQGSHYAYEVDGCGNSISIDDANIPSLLSAKYLGFRVDEKIMKETRSWILSKKNKWYKSGNLVSGIGSYHTHGKVWHLSLVMEALTDPSQTERILQMVLATSSTRTGLHESVDENSGSSTRNWFGWANALYSEWMIRDSSRSQQNIVLPSTISQQKVHKEKLSSITAELSVITVTSPRPSHPDITVINQTLHAMYYHNPTWIKYPHYILMDGCPQDKNFWEHEWCTGYSEFVIRLRREIESRSYFRNVHIVEPPSWTTRLGLTGSIQNGFQRAGLSPRDIVYIQQDDTRFVNNKFDLSEIIRRTRQLEPPYVRSALE